MIIKHTLDIDLDALVQYTPAHQEYLKADDVQYLMGADYSDHNVIELELATEVDCYEEEPRTSTDPGCPAWAEFTESACIEDYAFNKTMAVVDDCPDPARKLRIFRVLSNKIANDYQSWADNKMESVALEQARREQLEEVE